jgi:hypothetical protein
MLMKRSERETRLRLLRQARILLAMTRPAAVRDTQFICEVLKERMGQSMRSAAPSPEAAGS